MAKLTRSKGRPCPKLLMPLSIFLMIMGCSTATTFLPWISRTGQRELFGIDGLRIGCSAWETGLSPAGCPGLGGLGSKVRCIIVSGIYYYISVSGKSKEYMHELVVTADKDDVYLLIYLNNVTEEAQNLKGFDSSMKLRLGSLAVWVLVNGWVKLRGGVLDDEDVCDVPLHEDHHHSTSEVAI